MLKILGRKNSSNVQKVLWACDEIGLAFEREDYGLQFGKNKEPAYLAMNPNGTIPTIIDNGFVLWESNVIVRYLGAKYGLGKIMPQDIHGRFIAEQWMDWQQTVANPAINPVFQGMVRTKPENRDIAALRVARDKLAAAMAILDGRLAKAPYVAGARFTVADIPLGIITYRWYTMDIERENYPNLRTWYERLGERPAFKKHIMIGLT
jgi:glutathione S-transferase